jgi:hypothetical protein
MVDLIRPALDLTRNAWRQQHGDIVAIGTWWLADSEGSYPCMVLIPAFGRPDHPCVVSVDLAWIWSEEAGSPEFAMETAMSFAMSLGMAPDFKNCTRIAGIIRDHLGDLLSIKPRPADADDIKVVADAILTSPDGKERHAEIKDSV